MVKKKAGACFLGLLVALWSSAAFARGGPTVAEIASDWAAFSGGLDAKIVYWDMSASSVKVIDLVAETETAVATGLGFIGDYNLVCPAWSPDGTRITYHKSSDWSRWVINADGSNPVNLGGQRTDYLSWHDNDTIVLCTGADRIIQLQDIDASNNPVGAPTTIIDFPPYGGNYRSYVTATGDFVSWQDGGANAPYGHRSIVRRISTGEEMEVTSREDDACSITTKPDGSGTCFYNHYNHVNPAEVKAYKPGIDGGYLTYFMPADVIPANQIYYTRWSNHPNYVAHMGAEYSGSMPGYIRKFSDTSAYVDLGTSVWTPDIWVDCGSSSYLDVKTPDGGENWVAGTQEVILWDIYNHCAPDFLNDVKIEISYNSGTDWTTLVASIANEGVAEITVPDPGIQHQQCRIRISDAADGSPAYVSDKDFTITAGAAAGNGFNFFADGNAIDISHSTLNVWTDVDVSAHIPAGSTGVILDLVTGRNAARMNGSLDTRQTMSALGGHRYIFSGVDGNRIFESYINNAASKIYLMGYTDGNVIFFENAPEESISSLDTWTDIDISAIVPAGATGVIVEAMMDRIIAGGYGNVGIRRNGSTADRTGDGGHSVYENGYTHLMCGLDANRIFEAKKASDAIRIFIRGYTMPPVTFIEPVQFPDIPVTTWTSVDLSSYGVPVSASSVIAEMDGTVNGNIGATMRKPGSTDDGSGYADLGRYQFTHGACGSNGATIEAWREHTALIMNVLGYCEPLVVDSITVTSPDGGENLTTLATETVTWTSMGTVGNVQIEITTDGGCAWTTLIASTSDDGSEDVTLPDVSSSECLIRVSEPDGAPGDSSDSYFTISGGAGESITVTNPDGGENWTGATTETVTWSTTGGVGNVKIELSTDGGSTWAYTLVASTANDGSEDVTVPSVSSVQCRVQVSETDGSPADTSDADFTISIVDTTPPGVSVASVVIDGTASDAGLNPPIVTVAGTNLGQMASFSNEVTLTGSTIVVTAEDGTNTTTILLDVTVP